VAENQVVRKVRFVSSTKRKFELELIGSGLQHELAARSQPTPRNFPLSSSAAMLEMQEFGRRILREPAKPWNPLVVLLLT
jgi:hypothetical protein